MTVGLPSNSRRRKVLSRFVRNCQETLIISHRIDDSTFLMSWTPEGL